MTGQTDARLEHTLFRTPYGYLCPTGSPADAEVHTM